MVKIILVEGNLEMLEKIKEGLCVEGLDIRKGLIYEHVFLVDCEVVWGRSHLMGSR